VQSFLGAPARFEQKETKATKGEVSTSRVGTAHRETPMVGHPTFLKLLSAARRVAWTRPQGEDGDFGTHAVAEPQAEAHALVDVDERIAE
jgi:hypothetical protein